jgi:hypothetical protein
LRPDDHDHVGARDLRFDGLAKRVGGTEIGIPPDLMTGVRQSFGKELNNELVLAGVADEDACHHTYSSLRRSVARVSAALSSPSDLISWP